jgi:hypothetical protein
LLLPFGFGAPVKALAQTLLVLFLVAVAAFLFSYRASTAANPDLQTIAIDYPESGSLFPPEITPPTFLFRDSSSSSVSWTTDVSFTDGSSAIHVTSPGKRFHFGEIDPRCVSGNNELPRLTPQQSAQRTWMPDAQTWELIKRRSRQHPATVTITGFSDPRHNSAVSRGSVTIQTSDEPVGAPIFYRDVPLIPSEQEEGVIKPLAQADLPLLAWRLRDISQPRGRLLLTGLHTCANCHSFSLDGKTFGMDLDGPANDKGLYILASIQPKMSIQNQDVISWSSLTDDSSSSRVGFMSQVSPNGRYVITMLRGLKKDLADSYFVVNFKDYRFLQVFYPTRGVLGWYDRAAHQRHTLPGADDPAYVQTNPVWTPDGSYIVFARAAARDPRPPHMQFPEHANDPQETQIQYDLYRVPFNNGQGGQAVPIEGASHNGMSNSFPKVSPDGRWIVFVQCRNGQLMRPDSQLYIIPARGGAARRLRSNTSLMNSWHSFSPNGHWLVFSSKSRSPYTQMFLTHIDSDGNDSPAILIDNATAANRAVNIPEFVNIPDSALLKIDVPAAESYRRFDLATELTARGELQESIAAWKQVLELDPLNAKAHGSLGSALMWQGNLAEGTAHLQKARELDPNFSETQTDFGISFFNREQFRQALQHSECNAIISYGNKILAVAPGDSEVKQSVVSCTLKHPRQQMRTALQHSDCPAAVTLANQILVQQPQDPEARQALSHCSTAAHK